VIQQCRDAVITDGPDRVSNMDETGWKGIQVSAKAVARQGVESVPSSFMAMTRPKSRQSVRFRKRLAPIYLLCGTTKRCLADFVQDGHGDHAQVFGLHEGSNDEGVAHFPLEVTALADRLSTELIPLPKGPTGNGQPLDRRCLAR
jgi:hypothetical protein